MRSTERLQWCSLFVVGIAGLVVSLNASLAVENPVSDSLRTGDCVLEAGSSNTELKTVEQSSGSVESEDAKSDPAGVCEGDDSNAKVCNADENADAAPPNIEDALCYCPGGICCSGTCYPGAACCIAGIGYECCNNSHCPPEDPWCVGRTCIGGPD